MHGIDAMTCFWRKVLKTRLVCHLQSEGVLGLYRGFGMSIATFVPTSGIWWGAYGAYQKLIWNQVTHFM